MLFGRFNSAWLFTEFHGVFVLTPPQPWTHGPLSGAEVLQGPSSSLQGVVVLALRQQRQVEPHYFWLIQQLKSCRETHTDTRTHTGQTQMKRQTSQLGSALEQTAEYISLSVTMGRALWQRETGRNFGLTTSCLIAPQSSLKKAKKLTVACFAVFERKLASVWGCNTFQKVFKLSVLESKVLWTAP